MSSFPTGGTGGTIGPGEGSLGGGGMDGGFVESNPEVASQVDPLSPDPTKTLIEDFGVDPNLTPYMLVVPTNGGDIALIQVRVVQGTWGSTVYKVYASVDRRSRPTLTAAATLNSTTTAASITCSGFPFVLVVLDTAHGSSGNYHSIQASVTQVYKR